MIAHDSSMSKNCIFVTCEKQIIYEQINCKGANKFKGTG